MALEAKEAASSLIKYAPIAREMAQANLSEAAMLKIKRKMDITYKIAKENLAFTEMGVICELKIIDLAIAMTISFTVIII